MKFLEIFTKIEICSKIPQSKFWKLEFFRKFDENRNFSKILTKIESFSKVGFESKICEAFDQNRNFSKF